MAQVVCRRSFKVVARAQSQFSPGGICGRSGTGKRFSPIPSAFSSHCHSTSPPYSLIHFYRRYIMFGTESVVK